MNEESIKITVKPLFISIDSLSREIVVEKQSKGIVNDNKHSYHRPESFLRGFHRISKYKRDSPLSDSTGS
jgi:hypothetical protein